jgi:hypothetical protein
LIERYNKTVVAFRNYRNTKSYKVRSNHVKFIIEIVKDYPEITIKDLLSEVKNKLNDFDITDLD